MSLYSAAKAAVEESDVQLDSPATLMELYLSPALMLLRKFHCTQLHVLAPALAPHHPPPPTPRYRCCVSSRRCIAFTGLVSADYM